MGRWKTLRRSASACCLNRRKLVGVTPTTYRWREISKKQMPFFSRAHPPKWNHLFHRNSKKHLTWRRPSFVWEPWGAGLKWAFPREAALLHASSVKGYNFFRRKCNDANCKFAHGLGVSLALPSASECDGIGGSDLGMASWERLIQSLKLSSAGGGPMAAARLGQ